MPRKPGAKAIVIYQGKMALVLRDNDPLIPYPNTWNIPGGGIEEGEGAEEAVRRELLEEICINPKHLEEREKTLYPDGSEVFRFFSILSPQEYEQVKLGNEGQCLDWFTYDEAIQLDLSPFSRAYFEEEKEIILQMLNKGSKE